MCAQHFFCVHRVMFVLLNRLALEMTAEEFKHSVLVFKQKLYRLGLRLLNDQQEAADVVQDVFVKLWNMREQLTQYRSIEALAMTMTRNVCLDRLKTPQRMVRLGHQSDLQQETSNPESAYMLGETTAIIAESIRLLPQQQQLVMHLRDVEHYEFEEIASITGMNLNHIRVNLSRARKAVRERLVKHHNYAYQGN